MFLSEELDVLYPRPTEGVYKEKWSMKRGGLLPFDFFLIFELSQVQLDAKVWVDL